MMTITILPEFSEMTLQVYGNITTRRTKRGGRSPGESQTYRQENKMSLHRLSVISIVIVYQQVLAVQFLFPQ